MRHLGAFVRSSDTNTDIALAGNKILRIEGLNSVQDGLNGAEIMLNQWLQRFEIQFPIWCMMVKAIIFWGMLGVRARHAVFDDRYVEHLRIWVAHIGRVLIGCQAVPEVDLPGRVARLEEIAYGPQSDT